MMGDDKESLITIKSQLYAHVVLLAHHTICSLYTNVYVDFHKFDHVIIKDMDQYRFRYLTTWNFMLQCTYLAAVTASDVVNFLPRTERGVKLQKTVHKLRGYVYTTFVFPTAVLVFAFFWTLWFIDRNLVFPEVIDEVLPTWVNHSIHTNILILPFVESLIHKRIPTFKSAAVGSFVFSLAYIFTFFLTYYQSSRWLYNVFMVISWTQRLTFMLISYFTTLVLIKVSIYLQNFIQRSKNYNTTTATSILSKKLL